MSNVQTDKPTTETYKNSVIANDSIWRQTIKYELQTANNWEKNWGFVRDAHSKASTKLPPISVNIDPHKSGLPSKLNTGLAEGSDSIISDWMYGYNTEKIVKYRYPASKYSFPATTSSEVGWPWGRGKEYGAEENIGSDGKGPGHRPAKSRYSPKYYTLETYKINTRGVDASLKFFGGPEAMP